MDQDFEQQGMAQGSLQSGKFKRYDAAAAMAQAQTRLSRITERFKSKHLMAPIADLVTEIMAKRIVAMQVFGEEDPRFRHSSRVGANLSLVDHDGRIFQGTFKKDAVTGRASDRTQNDFRVEQAGRHLLTEACVCPVTGRAGYLENIPADDTVSCKTPLSPFAKSRMEFNARSGFFDTIAHHPEIAALIDREAYLEAPGKQNLAASFKALDASFRKAGRQAVGMAVWAFRKNANPEAVRLADRAMKWDYDFQVWVTGEDRSCDDRNPLRSFLNESPTDARLRLERARNRGQAIDTYPILASLLVKPEVTAAIDNGAGLAQLLMEEHGVSRAGLRLAQDLDWRRAGSDVARDPVRFLNAAANAAAPARKPEWRALSASRDLIRGVEAGPFEKEILSGVGDRWADVAQMHRREPIMGAMDVMDDIARNLVKPILAARGVEWAAGADRDETEAAFIHGKKIAQRMMIMSGLPALGRTNIDWHNRREGLHASLVLMAPEDMRASGDTWSALVGVVASEDLGLPKGLRARELTSSKDLSDEGARQNHCVGGHTNAVLRGDSVIFAIETLDGDPVSTLEVRVDPHDPKKRQVWVVGQNMAKGNTAPPAASAKMAERLVDVVAKAAHADRSSAAGTGYFAQIAKSLAASDSSRPIYGPDASWEVVRAAYAVYRPVLPKSMTRKGFDSFLGKVDEAAVAVVAEEVEVQKQLQLSREKWSQTHSDAPIDLGMVRLGQVRRGGILFNQVEL